jgi:proteasome lid subunit RPN8/RPN11
MLRIADHLYAAIRRHGEETYPNECCGILLGVNEDGDNRVIETVRAGNTRTDSAHNRYHIAPQELVRAQREGRERGLDIVGFYHSHPDHPAMWSPTDLAEAHWMTCSYVITSVEKGAAQRTNSFLLIGTGEDDKRLEIERVMVENGMENGAESTIAGAAAPSITRC